MWRTGPSYAAGGRVTGAVSMETVWRLLETSSGAATWHGSPPLCTAGETEVSVLKRCLHLRVHCNTTHNSQDVEIIQASMNEERKRDIHLYNGILFNHKKKEIVPFATTWMNLESIKISRTGSNYCVISLTWGIFKKKTHRNRDQTDGWQGWKRWGDTSHCFIVYIILMWQFTTSIFKYCIRALTYTIQNK